MKEKLKDPLFWAFVLPVFYWIYLFFTTQMSLGGDADGYFNLATLIIEEGSVAAYLDDHPKREFVYPLLVASAMKLGAVFNASFQSVLKIFQMIILFLTQVLTYRLMKKFDISRGVMAAIVFYLGISPSMVNSAFSIYSEILTYPFVLIIILITFKCVPILKEGMLFKNITWAFILAIAFGLLAYNKAIAEYVFYGYSLFFVGLIFQSLLKKDLKSLWPRVVFTVIMFLSFNLFVGIYKNLNYQYNGYYTIADRGAFIFYANTVKRTDELSRQRFLASMAQVPGEGVCKKLFPAEDCYHWGIGKQDYIGMTKTAELEATDMPGTELYHTMMHMGKENILKRPIQYFTLTFIECFKIFFWESTQVGYVNYPPLLHALFANTLFKNGIRLIAALITFAAFIWSLLHLWKRRFDIFQANFSGNNNTWKLSLIMLFILFFTAFYSLSTVHVRYVFPVVPLLLVMIAFMAECLKERKRKLPNEFSNR